MLVRIANREDPCQTASEAALSGYALLSMPFWQSTSVQNFGNFTV